MSTIAEIARAEAEAAEAENPDELETPTEPDEPAEPDEGGEDEQTPELEPGPEPVTEAALKRVEKAIAAEDARHEKALRKAYGELWGDRQVCPLCLQEGFVVPAGPGEFEPDHRAAVEAAMGVEAEPEYKVSQRHKMCDECDGLGAVLTGAHTETGRLAACQPCMGTGYVDKPYIVPPAPLPVSTIPTATIPGTPTFQPDMTNQDAWGRPMGHPHWGISPAQAGI